MSYMLIGTFLVAGSMGALELDQIGFIQSGVQALIGLSISAYGYKKDMEEVDAEEQEDVIYYIPQVRKCGDYCKNPYYN